MVIIRRENKRMRTNELMLYKHMEEGNILRDMTFLIENYNNDYYNQEDLKGLLYRRGEAG